MVDQPTEFGCRVRTATSQLPATASQNEHQAAVETELRGAASALVERYLFARQHGVSFSGARDLYAVLGYCRKLLPQNYMERYRRGGIAGRVVDAYPKATWRGKVDIVEDDDPNVTTTFEQAWRDLDEEFEITSMLERVDILSGLGRYAVLLIGAGDGSELSAPLSKRNNKLIFLAPFGERDAKIAEWDQNTKSRRFGFPERYNLTRADFSFASLAKPVHHSRILHVAEGLLEDEVFGLPRLERVWNLIDDLEKVTGGGAEAYWLRANRGTQFDLERDMTLSEPAKQELKTQVEEYAHQMRRILQTRGVTVKDLGSEVANFDKNSDTILSQIAGSIAIPKRILVGSEMGQLASGQDRDNWDTQVKDRRTGYAAPRILKRFIKHLVAYGFMPAPQNKGWKVVWPEADNLTETERAEGAEKWATINKLSVEATGEIVFTNEEIRDRWYGFKPLTPAERIIDRDVTPTSEEDDVINRLEAAIRSKGKRGVTVSVA
jgi:hypothetical protein